MLSFKKCPGQATGAALIKYH